jgi:tight adherence protein B
MAFLIFVFVMLGVLTFAVLAFATRQTAEQKAVERRLTVLTQPKAAGAAALELGDLVKREASSSFDWAGNLLERSTLAGKLQRLLVQADSTSSIGTIVAASLGAALMTIFVAYVFTSLLFVALGAGVFGAYLPIAFLKFKRARRLARFDAALTDCIDMMSRSLRAGHSLPAAMSIVADQAAEPAKFEFGEVFKKQNYGLPLRDALMQMLDRVPSQDLRVLVTGMVVQKDTGGNLAEMLDRVVFVIRDRIRIKGEIKTHTAQGRMTGWILCALPVVMLVLINLVNPGYSAVLTSTELGHKLLYLGIALLSAGAFLIRKIVNGIEV